MTVVQIQSRQNGTGPHPFIFVVARSLRVFARTPATTAAAPQKTDTFADHFDFGANVRALEQSMEAPAAAGATPAATRGTSVVPEGYRPATDAALSATAQQAVEFSASWRAQQNGAAPGPDGRVLFAFGAGLPTVVCAPLRVCLIELQPGEKLVGEPQIGDSVRWNVAPATYGKSDESTAMLVLKPQMPGLDTNLLITTDRRAYDPGRLLCHNPPPSCTRSARFQGE
jgi:Conjugal transfer protein